jgi:ACS family hexuronate transporter-like MFS transporter
MSARPISNLRWWIGGLLFLSTVINYMDRQTLALLAPFLKQEYHWKNTDYANLLIVFRVGYSLGQAVFGRVLDRLGTRRGISLTVLSYSIIAIATSTARGFFSFATFRGLLGLAESANWPGATKAVSEWFPRTERALATALFDSGSSIGGALAPFIVLGIYSRWGWRVSFVVPGALGFLWLILWRRMYYSPANHPRISRQELNMITADNTLASTQTNTNDPPLPMAVLLRLPQTWGAIFAKTLTDPVWFFIADWFPIYLIAKGIPLQSGLIAVWIPFIAADLGNFFGGIASGALIKHGWTVGAARKSIVVFGSIGVLLLIPTIFTVNLYLITVLFALSTFSFTAYSTIANVLPSDLFFSQSVASVSGLTGSGAGIGTIVAFKLIGYFSDQPHVSATHSFDQIIIVASLMPMVGMLLIFWLVRNTEATRQGLVREI